jgi:hypothetical protein
MTAVFWKSAILGKQATERHRTFLSLCTDWELGLTPNLEKGRVTSIEKDDCGAGGY